MEQPRSAIPVLNVAETKRRFSELLSRVSYRGETIVISRRGRPIAKLVPIEEAATPPCRLLEIKGWLEDDDPFISALEGIASGRRRHAPGSSRRREHRNGADGPDPLPSRIVAARNNSRGW